MRCFGDGDPEYERYHDDEWGRPVRDERGLFERLTLEAFQSGLSWLTILRKREGFRAAFAGFDPTPSRASGTRRRRLMADAGIVRNRRRSRRRSPTPGPSWRCARPASRSTRSCWPHRPRAAPGAAAQGRARP